jgi:hypothetical protein
MSCSVALDDMSLQRKLPDNLKREAGGGGKVREFQDQGKGDLPQLLAVKIVRESSEMKQNVFEATGQEKMLQILTVMEREEGNGVEQRQRRQRKAICIP